ncbi:MAG: 6,7-dimethyl-8-ribityllumazine synthase [Ignavibacteriales bacterium]|nr:6,7-dimethyl-8-ribityllumazine synthase [Ignavibacteriales bacterium]
MNPKKYTQKMFQGSAATLHFAIVVSRFNHHITAKLLEGAEDCLRDHGVPEKNRKVIFCPGAFELPQVANRLAFQRKWDAIICLGAVIRGDTPHFEYISAETARGIQEVALRYSLPVVFGVLTTDNEQQARDRVGGMQGNKGWDAALTALEMAALFKTLKRKSR